MDSNFVEIGKRHPCSSCSAPCCKLHMMGVGNRPANFMDLDWFRYSLNFPDYELLLDHSNTFTLIRWADCRHFLAESRRCGVHGLESQPRICVYYNPWKCWYKANFTTEEPRDLVRMNAARYEAFLEEVVLDDNNVIVSHPDMMKTRALTAHIPLTVRIASRDNSSKTSG